MSMHPGQSTARRLLLHCRSMLGQEARRSREQPGRGPRGKKEQGRGEDEQELQASRATGAAQGPA